MGTLLSSEDRSFQPQIFIGSASQHHWVGKLLGFDFAMEYKPGSTNTKVDALSRHDTEVGAVLAISSPQFDFLNRLRQAQATDPALVALWEETKAGQQTRPWSIIDGLVVFDRSSTSRQHCSSYTS